ncbi:SAV_6107 family HEPN domain-containing protein [Rhodococcus sp. NPDC058505]|uniref:SAV_6107 family HEPN domain-containing protein n=1 Tax=unclassified Rhodococcus (in: high G+C Gram-positive bacteria) TaxID=192944 RepID=UPI003663F3E4
MAVRVSLLDRADALLAEAGRSRDPSDRFRAAYLAALRGAGAALAGRTPRCRSRSAWVLLSRADPELAGWADYFAAHSETRAAIEAGISRTVTAAEADRFHSEVSRFLTAVEDRLAAVGALAGRGDGSLARASA